MQGVYTVEVGVSLRRLPREDARLRYLVTADNGHQAELIAQQWASSRLGVVMAVSSLVIDWPL